MTAMKCTVAVLFVLMGGFLSAADEKAEAIKAMTARWQQVSTKGFTDVDQARKVMASYPGETAALTKLKTDGALKTEVAAASQAQSTFDAYLQTTRGSLDKELTRWLKSAGMMAKRWDMVSSQAQASGTNVPQAMIQMYKRSTKLEETKKKVGIYTAIAGSKDAKAQTFNQQLSMVEKVGVKMGAVDSAVTPRDSYAGGDKAALKAAIKKSWKEQYAKDTILGIRFIDEKWSRRTEKRYNNVTGWYPLDFSSLEVKVVIKEDAQMAGIYPVYLTKDHLKKDDLEIDAATAKSAPGFKSQMLLKNYKP